MVAALSARSVGALTGAGLASSSGRRTDAGSRCPAPLPFQSAFLGNEVAVKRLASAIEGANIICMGQKAHHVGFTEDLDCRWGSGSTRPTLHWPSEEGRGARRGGVCCAAKRKGGGKVDDAKGQVLLEPDKGWSPGFNGLLFGPRGELRLDPELANRQLTDEGLEDLGNDAPRGKPPDQANKKTEKRAKEIKKPPTVAEMELAGIPVNDQLRQMLKEERRKAAKSETEQLKTKQKGPRPRGWQMPEANNREVHKLLKIVGGQASGKRLLSPADRAVRPMMEVVRAAVFNMLQTMVGLPTLEGRWLDLYSGTGSVGLEALSRGCESCHFVELDPWVVTNVLQPNIDNCDFNSESIIHTQKVEAFFERMQQAGAAARGAFDFISVTPPYEAVTYGALMTTLATSPAVGKDTFIIVEYPYRDREAITEICGQLVKLRDRRYGRTNLAIYGPDWAEKR